MYLTSGISAKIYTNYQEGDKLANVRGISTSMRASQKIQSPTILKKSPCLHETCILMEQKVINK